MFPELRQKELADSAFDSGVGFPRVMRELSPVGLRGLLMVTFFAAFMSTISTQMNWGASYLIRDIYQRFFAPEASEHHLTRASKVASFIVLVAGGVAAVLMQGISVDAAWQILLALGAGTGAVFMLRWFWWRINAWSEIVSMLASLVFFLAYGAVLGWLQSEEFSRNSIMSQATLEVLAKPQVKMLVVAVLTIFSWLVVTYMTPPESEATLDRFYTKVRPGGPGWRPVAARNPTVIVDKNLKLSIAAALFATGIVYSMLPAIGNLIFGHIWAAISCGTIAILCIIAVAMLAGRLQCDSDSG